jgi:hypothetical protein
LGMCRVISYAGVIAQNGFVLFSKPILVSEP